MSDEDRKDRYELIKQIAERINEEAEGLFIPDSFDDDAYD